MNDVYQKPKKVLIIDDEKSFCEIFSFALKKEGFEVNYFDNPQQALIKIIEDIPDVIILDISMPGINGFELLSFLQKDLASKGKIPPIIIISNLKYREDGKEINSELVKEMGAYDFIPKSEDLDKIIEKIKESLKINQN